MLKIRVPVEHIEGHDPDAIVTGLILSASLETTFYPPSGAADVEQPHEEEGEYT
jgi:hypothetical protein